MIILFIICIFSWLALLGGLVLAIIPAITFSWLLYACFKEEFIYNNRVSPNGTDYKKMNMDKINGKSESQIRREWNKGKYDL